LSTFSWHMGNVIRIIRDSTERSLVLLDELGTSNDPGEGAALAKAILLHFRSRKTMTVATTHYGELKVFAHTTPGPQKASLDFAPVTLRHPYHLTVGIPGGSNAMAIAAQLGLPAEIVAAAKEMQAKGTEGMETLLSNLMAQKEQLATLRGGLEKEKADAESARKHLDAELQRLADQKQSILQEARNRLDNEAAQLERQVRDAALELKQVKSRERIENARKALAALRQELGTQTWQTSQKGATADAAGIGIGSAISPGSRVWLKDMALWGTALSLSDDGSQVDVQLGHSRLRLSVADIEKTAPPAELTLPPDVALVQKDPRGRQVSRELDLRGKRADEVSPDLDAYLNDAFLSQMSQVRIIHGFGTGTVRQIVRDMLASHPLVKSFRYGEKAEGGDGVTVVEL
ncbi:MAG: Smr/MutS family protein, partial [Chloroflexi bacterium]|nr:Smr/MutS family protein [Chloroflexota bacterium]